MRYRFSLKRLVKFSALLVAFAFIGVCDNTPKPSNAATDSGTSADDSATTPGDTGATTLNDSGTKPTPPSDAGTHPPSDTGSGEHDTIIAEDTDTAAGGTADTQGPETTGSADAAAAAMPGEYPPILISINIHGHNYGYPLALAQSPTWMTTKKNRYAKDKIELLWLAQLAESVETAVDFQLNGEYCLDSRLLDGNDTGHLLDLEEAGHAMGSHFHMYRYTGQNFFWQPVSQATATEADLDEIWDQQIGECELVLGHSLSRVDPAIGSSLLDTELYINAKKEEYGAFIEPGGESLSYSKWNFKPWNPFRRALGTKLSEDPDRASVSVSSIGQVGQLEPAGKHQIMGTTEQIQRQFLALVSEWREHERNGDPPKLWQFGIMTHPNQNLENRGDVETLVQWFHNWTQETTLNGNAVAEFATGEQLLAKFETWEDANPGVSSFSYDWDAHLAGNSPPYPYDLEGVTLGLLDCEFEEELTLWQDLGVRVFKLRNREVLRGPANLEGQESMTILGLRDPVYLLWSNTGESVTVDFSSQEAGPLYQSNSVTGAVSVVDAQTLVVTPMAMVVSGTDLYWHPVAALVPALPPLGLAVLAAVLVLMGSRWGRLRTARS
jgi:hypothetical protein